MIAKMICRCEMVTLVMLCIVAMTWGLGSMCEECNCFHRKNKLHIDCSYMDLEEIPGDIPTEVHHLQLQGNAFPDLGTTTTLGVTPLTNLKVLFLHNNPIAAITATFFDICPRLHTLMLHHTEIATIPTSPSPFSQLTRMKWLWLNNNQIANLYTDTFTGMSQLRELYLFNNSIITMPNGVFKDLEIVKHLYMHENRIPLTEIDCCQLCGLPEPIDVKWGYFEQDDELKCGYDAPVLCTIGGTSNVLCYEPESAGNGNKGKTYIFSAAGREWTTTGLLISVSIVLATVCSQHFLFF